MNVHIIVDTWHRGKTRIQLDDVDVTRYVQSIHFSASVDTFPTLVLQIVPDTVDIEAQPLRFVGVDDEKLFEKLKAPS